MAFIKRLGWYLLGLSVGLIFLVLFLKKKSEETGVEFCYLPNCRVLKDMRSKKLTISSEMHQKLTTFDLDSLNVKEFLKHGEVDFSNSKTEAQPCKKYLVTREIDTKILALTFQNCSEEVKLEAIAYTN